MPLCQHDVKWRPGVGGWKEGSVNYVKSVFTKHAQIFFLDVYYCAVVVQSASFFVCFVLFFVYLKGTVQVNEHHQTVMQTSQILAIG